MGDFLASLFGGKNKTLNSTIGQAGSLQGFGQQAGETGVTDATKYYHSILSGDPTTEASALAPEIKAGGEQTQQAKNEAAEFGTRSGGTAAVSAGADAANRANILSMLGRLKSGAAGAAGSLGTSELGVSLNANDQEGQQAQQRHQNWLNSILGMATGSGLGTLESGWLGKLFKPS